MKTRIVLFLSLIFIMANSFAQNSVYKNIVVEIPKKPNYIKDEFYLMRQAIASYNSGAYGEALKRTEFAREYRRSRVTWELYTLRNSLRPAEVQRVGDSMSEILDVLKKREDRDAIEIIARYQKNPRSQNATLYASRLLAYIETFTEFPEADQMFGNIYYIEGDYDLAKRYYNSAWNNRNLLDVPEEQFHILYQLAELSYLERDEIAYEEYLTAIVRDDAYFNNPNLQDSMLHIISLKRKGSADNLFNLFRTDHYMMMDAYVKLAEIYEKNERIKDALYMRSLAAITGFTRMYTIVARRAPDYYYRGLEGFFERAANYSDVISWAAEKGVWQNFNSLSFLAEKNGYTVFAEELSQIINNIQIAKN